ncbi:putative GMC oxidoreductase [Naviculisporaceae sp. PSN 640]
MRVASNLGLAAICSVSATQVLAAGKGHGNGNDFDGKTYDYVIVGGGTSGLVVANRLTEDRRTTVLVIERGDFDNKPEAIVPWYGNLLDVSVIDFVPSAPNPKLGNAVSSVAVASVVGGGSVVNGMGYIRGSEADYDAWEELGNPGWGWHGLYPYFRKGTTFDPPTPAAISQWNITWLPEAFGRGPLHVKISSFQYPDIATFWRALKNQVGVAVPGGANVGNGPGAYWTPSTIDGRTETRATSRSAYYDPIKSNRPNLHLLTGQTATEILFHPPKNNQDPVAKGVQIVSPLDNKTRSVYAKKEVILAAGAIMTPHLLQLSGIGPAAVLNAANITVRKDLPGLGANYQDHATTMTRYSLANQSFPNPDTIFLNATYNATVWAEYLANKTGPIAGASATTLLLLSLPQLLNNSFFAASSFSSRLLAQSAADFLPSSYSTNPSLLAGYRAQREILARQFRSNDASLVAHALLGNGFFPGPLLKPLSRGTVTLNPSNPAGPPIIQFNTLQNPLDGENIASMVRHGRRFFASPEFAPLGPITELVPGEEYQTDDEILGVLTTNSDYLWPSLAHPSGTCAMMPLKFGGVVGPDLRVHGVKRLSVVDASIIPMIPGGALQATVYAVAEKAGDLIKGRG